MVLAHDLDNISRTRDIQITQDVTFDTMLLLPSTIKGLKQSGFYKPSPVQLHGVPLGKCGFDLILEAKSGTGKTAVFAIIALEKLNLKKGLQVVILAPTREIASQICDVIKQIGSNHKGLLVEVVMGGLPIEEDIRKLKNNVHIVVGSPGRLRHLIQDKHIDVTSVRVLVLDEADKLMESSFQADINYIFSTMPYQKQVILSSATYPESTKMFINKYVTNAQHVCPNSNCILLGVEQNITLVKYNTNIVRQTQYRYEELLKILSQKSFKQCLIFCNYQARVVELHKLLQRAKWPVEQLYGRQEQTDRLDALKTLQEYKCRILISTDLAARGIDASNVDLVINFEAPFDWQTYLHRIGRAGRYGSYGMSITILSEGKEEEKFKSMLEAIKDSLNICDFWNNDKFTFDDTGDNILQNNNASTNNSINLNICQEKQYQDLWNELISGKNSNQMDTFEVLCKSYEEPKDSSSNKDSLESFKELLNSFESNKLEQVLEDSTYRHKKINSPAIKGLCDISKPIELINDKLISPKEIKLTQKNLDNKSVNKKDSLINSHRVEVLDQGRNLDDAQIEAEWSKAMLDIGLPVSFGSSKKKVDSGYKIKSFKNEPYKDSSGLSIQKETNSKIMNKDIKTKKSSSNHLNKEIIKNDRSSINPRSKEHSKIDRKINNYNYCFKGSGSHNGTYHLSKEYINWYKQLQFTVKQIEYSYYIDEMSKL